MLSKNTQNLATKLPIDVVQTGPLSAHGKQICSQNRRTHGLTSVNPPALAGAERDFYQETIAQLTDQYRPLGVLEQHLVTQIAIALLKQNRLWVAELAAAQVAELEELPKLPIAPAQSALNPHELAEQEILRDILATVAECRGEAEQEGESINAFAFEELYRRSLNSWPASTSTIPCISHSIQTLRGATMRRDGDESEEIASEQQLRRLDHPLANLQTLDVLCFSASRHPSPWLSERGMEELNDLLANCESRLAGYQQREQEFEEILAKRTEIEAQRTELLKQLPPPETTLLNRYAVANQRAMDRAIAQLHNLQDRRFDERPVYD